MKTRAIALGACVAIAMATTAPLAHADAPSAAEVSRQAQSYADQAYDAYQREDWNKAIAMYLESYKLVPLAEILFNIATIYDRKLGNKQLAIDYYRRHNASPEPSAELVGKATTRIAELTKPEVSATVPSVTPETPSSGGAALRTTGFVVGGVGLLGLGLGTAFGIVAIGQANDAHAAGCHNGTCPTADAADKDKAAATSGTVSTITFVAGGVLVAAGITFVLLAPKSKSNKMGLRITPSIGPSGAGLTLSGVLF